TATAADATPKACKNCLRLGIGLLPMGNDQGTGKSIDPQALPVSKRRGGFHSTFLPKRKGIGRQIKSRSGRREAQKAGKMRLAAFEIGKNYVSASESAAWHQALPIRHIRS